MRSRRWILFVAATILLLGVLLYAAKQYFRVDQLLQAYLEKTVTRLTGQTVGFGTAEAQPGKIKVTEVTWSTPSTLSRVSVGRISVTYKLTRLLLSGFDFTAAIDRIVIEHPVILLDPLADMSPGDLFIKRDGAGNGQVRLPAARLVVTDALVLVAAGADSARRLCWGMNGYAQHDGTGRVAIRLDGACVPENGSGENLSLRMEGNLQTGEQLTTVSLEKARLDFPVSLKRLGLPVSVQGGRLQAGIRLNRTPDDTLLHRSGTVTLREGSFSYGRFASPVTRATLDGSLNDSTVTFTLGAAYGPASLTGSGRLVSGREPRIDARLRLASASGGLVREFVPSLGDMMRFEQAVVTTRIGGRLSAPRITGELRARDVSLNTYQVQTCRLGFSLTDSVITLRDGSCSGTHSTVSVGGTVTLGRRGERVDLQLAFRENDLAGFSKAFLPITVNGSGEVRLAVQGARDSLRYAGDFNVDDFLLANGMRLAGLEGSYTYDKGALQFATHTRDREYHLEGQLAVRRDTVDLFGKLRINGVAIDSLMTDLGLSAPGVPGRVYASLGLNGHGPDVTTEGTFTVRDNPLVQGSLRATGSLHWGEAEEMTAELDLESRDLMLRDREAGVRTTVSLNHDEVRLTRLEVDDILQGNITLTRDEANHLEGLIKMDRVDFGSLMYLVLPGTRLLELAGKLDGTVTMSGTVKEPTLVGDFSIIDGSVTGIRNMTGICAFVMNREGLRFDEMKLFQGRQRLIGITGRVGYRDGYRLHLEGENVPVTDLVRQLAKASVVSGTGSYTADLTGPVGAPSVTGEARFNNGAFYHIGFDDLFVRFEHTAQTLDLREFRLTKGRDYAIEGFGPLRSPFTGKGPEAQGITDLSVNATGNLFELIPGYRDIMKKAFCYGKAGLRMGDRDKGLKVKDLNLLFSNGEILFGAYPYALKDLNGHLKYNRDKEFVEIQRMYGVVDGNRFSVSNVPMLDTGDRMLLPLTIDDFDLSLGAFLFDFGRRPAVLHVPGLFAKGEKGKLSVRGRKETEKLCLAGPNDHPVIRGEIGVSDADFTFPFILDSDPDASYDILERIDWDLRVIPERNARYFSDFANLEVATGEGGMLDIRGSMERDDFYIEGNLSSRDGELQYLGETFDVIEFGVEFDRFNVFPIVYGEGRRVDDRLAGIDPYADVNEITLRVYEEDELTKERNYRPRWDKFKFELTSGTGQDITDQVGIFADTSFKASDAIGIGIESFVVRPYLRPFERRIEKLTGDFSAWISNYIKLKNLFTIDMVRLNPAIARNLFDDDQQYSLNLFRRSEFTIGKNIYDNMFLTYTGYFDVSEQPGAQETSGLGLREHRIGLQYKIFQNLRIEYEYDYLIDTPELNKQDVRVRYFWYFDKE